MKKLNLEQMEKIEGGKFWGSAEQLEAIDDNSCPSGLRMGIFDNYYIFGIRTKHELVGVGGCIELLDTRNP